MNQEDMRKELEDAIATLEREKAELQAKLDSVSKSERPINNCVCVKLDGSPLNKCDECPR